MQADTCWCRIYKSPAVQRTTTAFFHRNYWSFGEGKREQKVVCARWCVREQRTVNFVRLSIISFSFFSPLFKFNAGATLMVNSPQPFSFLQCGCMAKIYFSFARQTNLKLSTPVMAETVQEKLGSHRKIDRDRGIVQFVNDVQGESKGLH